MSFSEMYASNPALMDELLKFSSSNASFTSAPNTTATTAPPAAAQPAAAAPAMPNAPAAPMPGLPGTAVGFPGTEAEGLPPAPNYMPGAAPAPGAGNVSILGQNTGMTPAQLTGALGGIGAAVRPAAAAAAPGTGGGMMPAAGGIHGQGRPPEALLQLLNNRLAMRTRVPGLLQR